MSARGLEYTVYIQAGGRPVDGGSVKLLFHRHRLVRWRPRAVLEKQPTRSMCSMTTGRCRTMRRMDACFISVEPARNACRVTHVRRVVFVASCSCPCFDGVHHRARHRHLGVIGHAIVTSGPLRDLLTGRTASQSVVLTGCNAHTCRHGGKNT